MLCVARSPQLVYAGDNFVRANGDVKYVLAQCLRRALGHARRGREIRSMQRFVWDANERGNEEINILANPSQAEKMHKAYQEKKVRVCMCVPACACVPAPACVCLRACACVRA